MGVTYKYRNGHAIHSGMGTDRHGHGHDHDGLWLTTTLSKEP